MPTPAQTYASLAALTEGAARAEIGAPPARRLHARVRRQPAHLASSSHEGFELGNLGLELAQQATWRTNLSNHLHKAPVISELILLAHTEARPQSFPQ